MGLLKDVNERIKHIIWNITKKPETALILVSGDITEPIDEDILNMKLRNSSKDEKIVIMYRDGKPIYYANFTGTTLYDFMNSIYNETQKKIGPDESNTIDIYSMIGNFIKSKTRQKMISEYEKNKLLVGDLIGDYYHFDGLIRKEKGKWIFGLGS